MNANPLILIVDDSKDNILMLKISLKHDKYDFIEASDGAQAVEMLKKHKPDVILMDAVMPVMDGYEATKVIKNLEEFSRIPILMITALQEKEDKIKAIECGVSDFISKPFDKTELRARCKSYVNLSRLNKQYTLSTKSIDTNLPNKSALFNDKQNCINPKLILFRIRDYELLENFYLAKVVKEVKNEFIKKIFILVPSAFSDAKLYNTNDNEFALLLDNQKTFFKDEALQICHTFYNNIKEDIIEFKGNRYNINIIMSFADNLDNLFGNARLGLNYAVKEQKEVIYANDIVKQVHKDSLTNIKTIEMIKLALKNDKVVSYFQPIYNNKTKQIDKYESLVRIIDKDDKVISPFFFLDIAKRGDYYLQISKEVLQNSFKALQEYNKEISINISSIEVEDKETSDMIVDFLEKNPKYSHKITFELLEDENIKDFDKMKNFITRLKNYGAKIAIDDFGVGYSNFVRLLEFQPDFLKIDASLIKNIEHNKLNRQIVEAIQDFARRVNIKTVAEFVSNENIFDIVNEIGIDYTQGYFIDEPRATIKGGV